LCFIISISKFKSGFHPVVYFFYFWKLFIIVFTNTLNVGSYTGLIMIVGIISENAILPIYSLKRHLLSKCKTLVYAISTRLEKLMTALGAIIALLPLAIGIGTGSELHQPLAIAVIGVLIAMPLLLIVLPSLLYYFNIEKKE
jgi:multidrug efflux pump subunit AcrB